VVEPRATIPPLEVEIRPGSENIVPGSEKVFYSYDGGSFHEIALTPVGNDRYIATFPAVRCGDTPRYYFQAEGDQGTVMTSPENAPAGGTYSFSVGVIGAVYEWDFETDPGWTTEAEWAFGQPTGGGSGQYGNVDPTSGYTGNNVYGYNLNGDYTNNMPEYHLTTTPFDCTGLEQVHVKFWRWLSVQPAPFDHAYIRISTDGTTWTTVWENGTGLVNDQDWTEIDLDISAIADDEPAVYLRWTMGTTNGWWNYCGWNIDDVQIWGFFCEEAYPPGDLNCDGAFNGGDIDPFFLAVGDPQAYAAAFPDCDIMLADMNGDGAVNGADIDPFFECLGGGVCP
jgi:hypothetical protein